jgi:hypothetical protein
MQNLVFQRKILSNEVAIAAAITLIIFYLFHYNKVVEQPRGFTHSVLRLGVQLDSSMPIIDIL